MRQAEVSNQLSRPVGIGVQGLADVFALLEVAYDSPEASIINRLVFEHIYYAGEKPHLFSTEKGRFLLDQRLAYGPTPTQESW